MPALTAKNLPVISISASFQFSQGKAGLRPVSTPVLDKSGLKTLLLIPLILRFDAALFSYCVASDCPNLIIYIFTVPACCENFLKMTELPV